MLEQKSACASVGGVVAIGLTTPPAAGGPAHCDPMSGNGSPESQSAPRFRGRVTFFRMEASDVQRRTLRLLFIAQIISGIGLAIGSSVGALLAADIAGVGVSGLAISTNVVGAALFAVPATAIVHRYGRRLSLAAG